MEQVPVQREGREVGILELDADGLYLCCRSSCRLQTAEILRLYAVGESGELYLGIPEPRNGALCLTRRIPAREIKRIGILLRGELRDRRTEEDGWKLAQDLQGFSEPLRKKLEPFGGIRLRGEGSLRLLAIPWEAGKLFPMPEWFCLAQYRRVNGIGCVIYAVDGRERPVIP